MDASARTTHRRLTPVAVLLLATTAALAFARVFDGPGPALRLAVAAGASAVLATFTARRSLVTAVLLSAAGLAAGVVVLVLPATTWFGLPTGRTVRVLLEAAQRIGDEAHTQIAPARATIPLLLAGVAAVWAAAFSTHALVVRAHSPVLAVFPPSALFLFAETALGPGRPPGPAVPVVLAVLALFFAFTRDVAAKATQDARRVPAGAGAITAAAVGASLLAPAFFPPRGTGLRPPDGGRASVDPLVSVGANLRQDPPTELFDIVSDTRPVYLRLAALDTFDGRTWNVGVSTGAAGSGPLPQATGRSLTVTAEVVVVALRGPWVPAVYRPQEVRSDDIEIRYEPASETLIAAEQLEGGDRYAVTSSVPVPSARALDAAPDPRTAAVAGFMSEEEFRRTTALPASFPADVRSLAERLTEHEPNAFRGLITLQEFLRSDFRYSETVGPPPQGADPLRHFLFRSRTGFCQQFAGAMAAMARALGYPARVAVGFLPGYELAQGTAVTTRQAHAWPEIFFPGLGWIAFEPTPTHENPIAAYLSPPPFTAIGRAFEGRVNARALDPDLLNPRAGQRRPHEPPPGPVIATQKRRTSPWPWVRTLIVFGAAAFVLLTPPATILRRWFRRRRMRRGDTRARVLAAVDVLDRETAGYGFGRGTAETLPEWVMRLRAAAPDATRSLADLLPVALEAAYRADGPEPDATRNVQRDVREVLRSVRRIVPLRRRIADWYRLRPATPPRSPSRRPAGRG